MRHRVKGKKLNRNASHRKAMFRNMALGLLIRCEAGGRSDFRIVTTLAKAKAVRGYVDKLITLGKRASVLIASAPSVPVRGTSEWKAWRFSPEWKAWAKVVAPAVCLRRRAFSFLRSDHAVRVLFDDVSPQFVGRLGGYTRVVRLSKFRIGDSTRLAIVELAIDSRRV